jgi:peroxiredoxin
MGLAALSLAALTAVAPAAGTGLASIRYDAPPPNFAIPTPHGIEYLSDLRGKVVVINFWASWCKPCTDELHEFVRAKAVFGDRIAIVTVSNELPDVAASYLRTWNIDLPLVQDLTGAIERLYSIQKVPDTLVLDPQGNVTYVSVGALSWKELEEAVGAAQAGSSQLTSAGRRPVR